MNLHIHTHAHTHKYMCVCVRTHTHTHTHTYIHTQLFIYDLHTHYHTHIYEFNRAISVMVSVRQWPGTAGSIPGRVIPKTQKMVLDASSLNTQHYKVWIKGKVKQSRESSALPYTSV